MTSIQPAASSSTSSYCKYCKSPLTNEALRCISCQSWQNWKGYVDSFTVAVTTLLSIIALFGIFWGPFYDYYKRDPILAVNIMSSSVDELSLVLSNSGKGTAAIKEIYINSVAGTDYNEPVGKDLWGSILKQGDILNLKLKNGVKTLPVIASKDHVGYGTMESGGCAIIVEYFVAGSERLLSYRNNQVCYYASPTPAALKSKRYD